MQVDSRVVNEAPRPAATLVLLRDGASGLEVFLLKRHGLSDILGGAYVFPGGKLDPLDCELDADLHLDQTPQAPSVMNKRFDTRFFLAALPAGQDAQHDNRETVESVWPVGGFEALFE